MKRKLPSDEVLRKLLKKKSRKQLAHEYGVSYHTLNKRISAMARGHYETNALYDDVSFNRSDMDGPYTHRDTGPGCGYWNITSIGYRVRGPYKIRHGSMSLKILGIKMDQEYEE